VGNRLEAGRPPIGLGRLFHDDGGSEEIVSGALIYGLVDVGHRIARSVKGSSRIRIG
jgi:hypothetical protein